MAGKINHPHSEPTSVSFREDVMFVPETSGISGRSGISTANSEASSHSSKNYSNLRASMMREQTNRDPLYYYQVTKHLGSGSMGDVKLVRKRPDKIGGSARRDIQQAVQRQLEVQKCLEIPILGKVFQLFMDGQELQDSSHNSNNLLTNSRHSVLSMLSGKSSDKTSTTTAPTSTSPGRSFEDSLLGEDDEDSTTRNPTPGKKSTSSNKDLVYAMKSIHLEQMTEQVFIDELRNEIAFLKQLDHPNIIKAVETFEWQGEISIVMEVCSGGDLYARDPYTEWEAAKIVHSITSAIAYMHARNMVHRDLKFENVLFVNTSPMSDVKLIDFGLSRVYCASGADGDKLTDIAGTIYTMAPEVINGNHTEMADMWSIGVITYMLLASALPFFGKTQQEVAKKILRNKISFKNGRWKTISTHAKTFIKRLLVLDPDDRASAQEILKSSEWLTVYKSSGTAALSSSPSSPQGQVRELAKSAMAHYTTYGKLKKMALMVVAHKSSSDDIGALRQLFEHFSSHDGSISWEGFQEAMMRKDQPDDVLTRNIFEAMDLDGSGSITYTEFIAATIEAHGRISEARLAEAFDRLDCDDSGFISCEDLTEILGGAVPLEEIQEIIADADTAKDGQVSYSEFMMLWEAPIVEVKTENAAKVLQSELSTITVDSDSSSRNDEKEAQACFLKEKHLQNTLHTWSLEMQLPTQEFSIGCSFLHRVALGNFEILAKVLSDRPTLIAFRDYDRRSPLHIAASEGLVDICEFLIKKGARVNRSDRWGNFPLDDAFRQGHETVVDLLRKYGGKFGSTSQVVNLITAASQGNVEEVKALLEFGSIDINLGDYDKRTPLHLACNEGHVEVVKLLCDAGADVNVEDRWGERPVDDARKANKNTDAIISILMGTAPDNLFQEPIATMQELKSKRPDRALAPVLDEGIAELSIDEFTVGCSFLHQAALGNQKVIEMMVLERPILIRFHDYDRRSALHLASCEGHVELCEFLLRKGAKINRVDRWGSSALDDAHRHRHAAVVKFLRKQGAKSGSTSQVANFILAAAEGDVEEVEAFLEYGSVDPNEGDYDNRCPIHLAASEGHVRVVQLLCEADADVNVQDRWGHRPLDEAKNAEIRKILIDHGATTTKMMTKLTTAFMA